MPYLRDFSRTHRLITFFRALGVILVVPACSVFFILIFARVQHAFLDRRFSLYSLSPRVKLPSVASIQFPAPIFTPELRNEVAANADRTVFLAPGKENDCRYYANYFCKFWFYIRCQLLAAFPNVRVLPSEGAVEAFARDARDGDVALLVIRRKGDEKKDVPRELQAFLDWRRNDTSSPFSSSSLSTSARIANTTSNATTTNSSNVTPDRAATSRQNSTTVEGLSKPRTGVRIGVFHIANEMNRRNWPWYTAADFVLRNYWVQPLPKHVMYVPLGGQAPRLCGTDRPVNSRGFKTGNGAPVCNCLSNSGVKIGSDSTSSSSRISNNGRSRSSNSTEGSGAEKLMLAQASRRKYLWHFSGSLRSSRKKLVRLLGASRSLSNDGYLKISSSFGGDGIVGDASRDPKIEYLAAMRSSAFVLVPCGNVMETHRAYEALNVGAIPLVEQCGHKRDQAFWTMPEVLVGNGVNGLVERVKMFKNRPRMMDALQRRVRRWWLSYLTQVAKDVVFAIDADVDVRDRGRI